MTYGVFIKINLKNIPIEPLFKIYKKTIQLFIVRNLSCTCF
jgi:hypothetical protein